MKKLITTLSLTILLLAGAIFMFPNNETKTTAASTSDTVTITVSLSHDPRKVVVFAIPRNSNFDMDIWTLYHLNPELGLHRMRVNLGVIHPTTSQTVFRNYYSTKPFVPNEREFPFTGNDPHNTAGKLFTGWESSVPIQSVSSRHEIRPNELGHQYGFEWSTIGGFFMFNVTGDIHFVAQMEYPPRPRLIEMEFVRTDETFGMFSELWRAITEELDHIIISSEDFEIDYRSAISHNIHRIVFRFTHPLVTHRVSDEWQEYDLNATIRNRRNNWSQVWGTVNMRLAPDDAIDPNPPSNGSNNQDNNGNNYKSQDAEDDVTLLDVVFAVVLFFVVVFMLLLVWFAVRFSRNKF